jgi:polysaccharide export outer membrane protein
MLFYSTLSRLLIILVFVIPLLAQKKTSAVPPVGVSTSTVIQPAVSAPEPSLALSQKTGGPERIAGYVLGPEDQIVIHAFQAEEISGKPVEISGDGYINLPLLGRVKAAGLTIVQLESALAARLATYIEHPQVTLLVLDYRSQPISVIGAVRNPGVIQLKGRKTLVEVIALAGGLIAESGNTVIITRELSNGRIPLASAADDPAGRISVARLNLRKVMDAQAPADNIVIEANDVLTVPRGQMVYVVGEVQRPGGYVLNERDTVSVLQALSLAGGLTPNASPKKAKILRDKPGNSGREEVASNVRKILSGDSPDVDLHPDDILFVPDSMPKSAGRTALQTALNMAGVAIWRIP